MNGKIQLPEPYEKNIRQAVKILRAAGCTHIFLFGSLAENRLRESSYIDIAVQRCPRGDSFSAADAELKIESVSPNQGMVGQDLAVTITGIGFDENTHVSICTEGEEDIAVVLQDVSELR
ncbi:hypothetical protein QUF80_02935 [Desulfococcaceae bacterium HSG8]|nr:hypothetical protein [Desulfococcaceae bacterium HSG8]